MVAGKNDVVGKKQSRPAAEEFDDEIAEKPVHPWVDHLLGVAFFALVARLAHEVYIDPTGQLGIEFLVSLVGVYFGVHIVRYLSRTFAMYISLARQGSHIPADLRHPLASALTTRKVMDQSWQLAIHVSMTVYEVYLVSGTTYWSNPKSVFEPCPQRFVSGELVRPQEFRLFYVLQLAIWIYTAFSCKFLESRRKDYMEMMIHHCVTIALILLSFVNKEWPVGLVILLVHDASDIVLDLMKLANYMKLEGPSSCFITEIFYVSNLCSWMYARLYIFPKFIVWESIPYYVENCLAPSGGTYWERCGEMGSCQASSIFLYVLCALHVLWFALLCRIGFRLIYEPPNKVGAVMYEGKND